MSIHETTSSPHGLGLGLDDSADSADSAGLAERVALLYDRVDCGDVAGIAALFAPGSTYHRPGYEPYVGPEGITRFYGAERRIRDGGHLLESVISEGLEVAVRGAFQGTLHDGAPLSLRFADFFVFDTDGLIARRDGFFFAPLA